MSAPGQAPYGKGREVLGGGLSHSDGTVTV